jgi:hypothetical protein
VVDPNLIEAISAAIGTVVVIGGLGWKFFRAIGQFVHMIDDMAGTRARNGVPARPGIMERLANMEASQSQLQVTQNAHTEQLNAMAKVNEDQSRVLNAVSHEVHFNNGSSVKDSTTRTEAALAVVAADVTAIKRKLGDMDAELESREEEGQ